MTERGASNVAQVERQLKSLCRNRGALTIFHRFDEDGSGELDGSEFRSMLKSVGEEVDDKKVEWPPGREHGATLQRLRSRPRSTRVG
jgi:hypothetical protein